MLPKSKAKNAVERLEELCKRQSPEEVVIMRTSPEHKIRTFDFRNYKDGFEVLTNVYDYLNDHSPRWHEYIELYIFSKKTLFRFYYRGIPVND